MSKTSLHRVLSGTKVIRAGKTATLAGLILLVTLLLLHGVNATGLGVSPTEIAIRNALRGGEYQRAIKIFNGGEDATSFLLNATGDISDWIYFYGEKNLTTPITNVTVPGKSDTMVFVVFRIPMEAPNGNHSSIIYVQTIPEEVSGTGASVVISAPVRVMVEVVGTQILTGTVNSITTMDTEINYPLRIKVDFQNTGNVVAKPEVKVTITKASVIIDKFTFSETNVKPSLRDVITVEWNTTSREAGDYVADVTVSLSEETLMEESLTFKLLPVGTLTRRGDLVSLSYTGGEPVVGLVIKIQAAFRNTGFIDTTAYFVGEVYKGDKMIEVIEGHENLVKVGTEEILSAYLKLTEEGYLLIKGYVVYDGKKTDVKELPIEVLPIEIKAPKQPIEQSINLTMLVVVAIFVVLAGVILKIRNTREKRRNRKITRDIRGKRRHSG